ELVERDVAAVHALEQLDVEARRKCAPAASGEIDEARDLTAIAEEADVASAVTQALAIAPENIGPHTSALGVTSVASVDREQGLESQESVAAAEVGSLSVLVQGETVIRGSFDAVDTADVGITGRAVVVVVGDFDADARSQVCVGLQCRVVDGV